MRAETLEADDIEAATDAGALTLRGPTAARAAPRTTAVDARDDAHQRIRG
ncbi:hypothetical protein AB0M39_15820 [Streptomyces sp. NPDC051907]